MPPTTLDVNRRTMNERAIVQPLLVGLMGNLRFQASEAVRGGEQICCGEGVLSGGALGRGQFLQAAVGREPLRGLLSL